MSLRRRGLWLAFGCLFVFYSVLLFSPPPVGEWVRGEAVQPAAVWSVAGRFLLALNVFFPVIVGMFSSDRLLRDRTLALRELQDSTALGRPTYVLGKYLGVLLSFLLPVLLWALAIGVVMTARGHTPASFLWAVSVAFLAITVPAFAFVVAFSLACPLLMPRSAYQILFTGYWFWGNFVPPNLLPTLNGTLLTPSGIYAWQGFFGGHSAISGAARTAGSASLNLAVLALCIVAVLIAVERTLAWRSQRA